jgi:DNA-3-methyladenine glycosylase
VTGSVNGVSLQRRPLRIIDGPVPKKSEIVIGPRIGITQAADWPLRFYLKNSPWVSR